MKTNAYFIDIAQITLARYQAMLEQTDLLPGRRILYEKMQERFALLAGHGILNLQLLVEATRSKAKLQQLAVETGIPMDYLIILRREVNHFLPKPVSIAYFPGIQEDLVSKLKLGGIHNTVQLFAHCDTQEKRKVLAQALDVPISDLLELTQLADLSRIWGVGPIFCRIFYETGVNTTEKVAAADAQKLYDRLMDVVRVKQYTKAKFTVKDVALCIEYAGDLPKTIVV